MSGRHVLLSALKGGIDRQKIKGNASQESLYDLVNGYVDASGTPVSRPGTSGAATLLAGTKGMCAYDGGLVVFSHQVVELAGDLVTCAVLSHPDNIDLAIVEIHFAGPFLGFLYVVAEFVGGDVFHYWLQGADTWQANTPYRIGQLVEPTIPNGLVYSATRVSPPGTPWAPNVARAISDAVEPTVPNGFVYTVVDTIGATPRSGEIEPIWPEDDGAQIYEDTDIGTQLPPSTSAPAPAPLPSDVLDRYTGLVLP